jgi:hypothetical protein
VSYSNDGDNDGNNQNDVSQTQIPFAADAIPSIDVVEHIQNDDVVAEEVTTNFALQNYSKPLNSTAIVQFQQVS